MKPVPLLIHYSAFYTQHVPSPWHRSGKIPCAYPTQRLWKYRLYSKMVHLFLAQTQHIAHQQMDTQCSPTVSLDTSIRIVNFAPFASSNGSTILSRHAWYTTIFIQGTSIYAPIRTIDEAISHLGGF